MTTVLSSKNFPFFCVYKAYTTLCSRNIDTDKDSEGNFEKV